MLDKWEWYWQDSLVIRYQHMDTGQVKFVPKTPKKRTEQLLGMDVISLHQYNNKIQAIKLLAKKKGMTYTEAQTYFNGVVGKPKKHFTSHSL